MKTPLKLFAAAIIIGTTAAIAAYAQSGTISGETTLSLDIVITLIASGITVALSLGGAAMMMKNLNARMTAMEKRDPVGRADCARVHDERTKELERFREDIIERVALEIRAAIAELCQQLLERKGG